MMKLWIGCIGLLTWGIVADAYAHGPFYSAPSYQVSGKLTSNYLPSDTVSAYQPSGMAQGYGNPGVYEGSGVYGGGIAVPTFGQGTAAAGMNRTYPGGIAPYRRYGGLFGFVRRDRGEVNPYEGIDPQAGNPYAGYTITRGPRDFLMKNPPNIGP